ncbi:MAG: transketolase [Gracilibacteraceae bacterium]|jgi:transketolase|nr:transketolase [Gracilibacteraceae bacterium]
MPDKEQALAAAARTAKNMRRAIIRMTHLAQGGHPGGCLSATDLLAALYEGFMRVDPRDPRRSDRDFFFLSKGHAAPALYAVLMEKGFLNPWEITDFRAKTGRLPAYPSCELTPGVDIASGSLGQGLSVANGAALAARLNGTDQRAYVMLGDGELHEGQVWEAMMTAAHFRLANVCAIVDYNKLQLDGPVDEVKTLGDLRGKWDRFGWHVLEINGHDLSAIYDAFAAARDWQEGPSVLIAHTVKGKGISFMEDEVGWHAAAPSDEEYAAAMKELS